MFSAKNNLQWASVLPRGTVWDGEPCDSEKGGRLPRKRKELGAATANGAESLGHYLTSGDIARMLHVDLKTIHNWVTQGHIRGSRTKGRHLRFERNRVVRFMREYGYPLPSYLGTSTPRVMVEASLTGPWLAALRKVATIVESEGLFACSLVLGSEPCEVAIVGLDQALPRVIEFCSAVMSWEATSGVALVGVGSKLQARHAFLAAGGTAALSANKGADLKALVQYLVGASPTCPASIEFADPVKRSA